MHLPGRQINIVKMKYLKLVRVHNIFIMALTLYIMRWAIIYPILKYNGLNLRFNELYFLILVLSVSLIAAGGYVINDYFDRRTDRINHPESVIVGKKVNRRIAMILHFVLSTLGVMLGILISILSNHWKYSIIFILISVLLWFYSTTFKRQFLIGNFVISVFTAMVPFIVVLFEFPPFLKSNIPDIDHIIYIVSGFAFFAFITNMIREILKDMEDSEGDAEIGCRTLPIILGKNVSKYIALTFVFITAFSVVLVYTQYLAKLYLIQSDNITKWYIIFLEILLIILAGLILRSKNKKDFHIASSFVKIVMLVGVLYSLVIYYLIN